MPDVSLLICTRDRAHALQALLASIERAVSAAPAVRVEVVIVDNGSTDGTSSFLASWAGGQSFPVVLAQEPQAGLARARNRGLARCGGRIIAMTDDDCVLKDDYLIALTCCFSRIEGDAIVGGRILLGDPRDLPVTIKTEDHPMIARPGAFPGGFVMGANLALTASVLHKVGMFDVRFGAGAPFLAAEDTDYLFRAIGLGVELRYDPGFVVEHHHGRRFPHEEVRLLAGYSFGDGALYAKHLWSDRRILRAIWDDIRMLPQDILRPVTQHVGVRYFYAFRLMHKVRGLLAFAMRPPKAWRRHAGTNVRPVR